MIGHPMVVHGDAVLCGVCLLFFVGVRRLVTVPVVVGLSVYVIVASVVLYTLMRMRVRVPEPVLVGVAQRSPLCA